MKDIKEFYILGLPIETPIGVCNFLKVKEYPDYYIHLQYLSLTKERLISNLEATLPFNGESKQIIGQLKQDDLFTLVISIQELRQIYGELLVKIFDNVVDFQLLNKDNFDYYRKLIMEMNCVKEEKINPNPEIQKWIEKSKRFKQSDEKLEFADIISSVVGYNGLSYSDINEMTIYQLYMTFQRIGQIKGYDTSTLFATVAEKVDIQSWCKHIDLHEEEKHGISREEFDKKIGNIFESE